MFVPLRVLTLRTSLHTYIYSQVYIYQESITDMLVYQPVLCTLTLVCALASAHTENLFVYGISIHVSCTDCLYVCALARHSIHDIRNIHVGVVRTHICLCPCECSHLEPLWIHTYAHKYTYTVTDTFVYEPMLCKLTLVAAPLRVLTHRTIFVYIY